jgi:hypothetical protein
MALTESQVRFTAFNGEGRGQQIAPSIETRKFSANGQRAELNEARSVNFPWSRRVTGALDRRAADSFGDIGSGMEGVRRRDAILNRRLCAYRTSHSPYGRQQAVTVDHPSFASLGGPIDAASR